MKIDLLIDRDYFVISTSEDTYVAYHLLKERPCYAVIDEKMEVIGIVTLNNVLSRINGQLKNVDFKKPVLSPNSSIAEAIELLKISENNFLPVYNKTDFVGIISLLSIAEYLLEVTKNKR